MPAGRIRWIRAGNRSFLSTRDAGYLAWSWWAVAAAQAGFGLFLAVLNRPSLERFLAEYVVSMTTATLAFAPTWAPSSTRVEVCLSSWSPPAPSPLCLRPGANGCSGA